MSERGAAQEARGSLGARAHWWQSARPPGACALAGWALLPLRAFLGATFVFAGIQKLANPTFFSAANPTGIQSQLRAASHTSPLHALLAHLIGAATPIGVLIAIAEIAVGLGTLVGLFTRLAAVGGALLSLTLFLTVSYHSSPYYTGADIVFLFAWFPFIIGGAGGVLSFDGALAERTKDTGLLGPAPVVPVSFDVIQRVCGHYEDARCAARSMEPCRPEGCPFLADDQPPTSLRDGAIERRTVLAGTATVGLVGAGVIVGLSRAVDGAKLADPTPVVSSGGTTTPTTAAPSSAGAKPTGGKPAGHALVASDRVPVGGSLGFTDPKSGDPGLLLQRAAGTFVAFNAVCPHAGCTVGYSRHADLIVCPCHGSEFNPNTGGLVRGPAPHGLSSISVAESNGELYVDG
jgi:thiosulfate dehydrogenase (quinone) large subunit